jgi:hypothetical protein
MMAYDRGMASKAKWSGSARVGRLPALALVAALAPLAGAMEQRPVTPLFEAPEAPVQAAREPPRAIAGKSVDRVVQDIEKKYNAKVLKMETLEDKGRKVLRLQLYDEKKGRVRYVNVDTATGKEL